MQTSLGRPHVVSKGLNIVGQGNGGLGMEVMHQGVGREAQVASGASGLSRRVVGKCVV